MDEPIHIIDRKSRYYINSQKPSFTTTLKGLAIIVLNITEMCTRKCSFCPRSDVKVYPNRKVSMTPETALAIAKNCKDDGYNGDIHISGFSEPLLNVKLSEILKNIRTHLTDNHIILTTNGDKLSSDAMKMLYDNGVDFVTVSCYEKESFARFQKLFEENNISTEQYKIRPLWYVNDESVTGFMSRNDFTNRAGAVTTIKTEWINQPCYFPFYKMMVDWNGDVLLCCDDWLRKAGSFGNLTRDNLSDVWYGEKFKSVREELLKGNRSNNEACKSCNVNGLLMGKQSVELLK